MKLHPRCLATAVGSLPHADAADAVKVVLEAIPDAPVWPQLPGNGLNEQMEVQYSEGLPRVVIDRDKDRMYIDTTGDYSMELASFYESFLAEELETFQITANFAKGLHAMEAALASAGGTRPFVKVQTTGPITFGLTVVDENKRAMFYHPEFIDIIVKGMAMKCRWQIRRFKPHGDRVICFLDEPILSAFGSSTYVSVTREDVVAKLNEVIEAIHAEDALAGIHCCGNTDWSIPVDAGADIVNFDAFEYGETVALYPDAIKRLLEEGRALAWGLVPTNAAKIRDTTPEDLVTKFDTLASGLAKTANIDPVLIAEQALITPACGMGSTPVAEAEQAFGLLSRTSQLLRERLG